LRSLCACARTTGSACAASPKAPSLENSRRETIIVTHLEEEMRQDVLDVSNIISDHGSLSNSSKEDSVPRGIEIEPALRSKPTRRQLGNMQKPMTSRTDQLRAVPRKEVARRLTNPRRIGKCAQAYRAPSPLIPERPSEPKQSHQK